MAPEPPSIRNVTIAVPTSHPAGPRVLVPIRVDVVAVVQDAPLMWDHPLTGDLNGESDQTSRTSLWGGHLIVSGSLR